MAADKRLLKVQIKPLGFHLALTRIKLGSAGKFRLRFRVLSQAVGDAVKSRVQFYNGDLFETRDFTSPLLTQKEDDDNLIKAPSRHSYEVFLPKGFCSNKKGVSSVIEVGLFESTDKRFTKCLGMCKVPIFPANNEKTQPQSTSKSGKSESDPLVEASGELVLQPSAKGAALSNGVGVITYTSSLSFLPNDYVFKKQFKSPPTSPIGSPVLSPRPEPKKKKEVEVGVEGNAEQKERRESPAKRQEPSSPPPQPSPSPQRPSPVRQQAPERDLHQNPSPTRPAGPVSNIRTLEQEDEDPMVHTEKSLENAIEKVAEEKKRFEESQKDLETVMPPPSRPHQQEGGSGTQTALVSETPSKHDPAAVKKIQNTALASRGGAEMVRLTVHAAFNVPLSTAKALANPFVIVRAVPGPPEEGGPSTDRSGRGGKSKTVSRGEAQTTHSLVSEPNPFFERFFILNFPASSSQNVLRFELADAQSRELLVDFELSLSSLDPFYAYHLELQTTGGMKYSSVSSDTRLVVSVMRCLSSLPRLPFASFAALEVNLIEFREKLVGSKETPLLPVMRVVPDLYAYRDHYLHEKVCGLNARSVRLPNPLESSFRIGDNRSQGFPQVCSLGLPPTKPVWNQSILFAHSRDLATLFAPSSALCLEFYKVTDVYTGSSFDVRRPIGYCIVPLTKITYQWLSDSDAKGGCRAIVPLLNTPLSTFMGKSPTLLLTLRLVHSEATAQSQQLKGEDLNSLPLLNIDDYTLHAEALDQFQADLGAREAREKVEDGRPLRDFDLYPLVKPSRPLRMPVQVSLLIHSFGAAFEPLVMYDTPTTPFTAELTKEGLPSEKALEQILPHYILPNEEGEGNAPAAGRRGYSRPPRKKVSQRNLPAPNTDSGDDENRDSDMLRYRTAIQRMGREIVALRRQVTQLEHSNSALRNGLSQYEETTKSLVDVTHLQGISKPELVERFAGLKHKLMLQTEEMRGYKDRVHKLQNELIAAQDAERRHLELSAAHATQQGLVGKLQSKITRVSKLEQACKQQEQVIRKMESLLKQRLSTLSRVPEEPNSGGGKGYTNAKLISVEAHDTLVLENGRLRMQIEDLMTQLRIERERAPDESQRIQLIAKLDAANNRIRALEKQLIEHSRRWGVEKEELTLRAHELQYGINGYSSSRPYITTRRRNILDPIYR